MSVTCLSEPLLLFITFLHIYICARSRGGLILLSHKLLYSLYQIFLGNRLFLLIVLYPLSWSIVFLRLVSTIEISGYICLKFSRGKHWESNIRKYRPTSVKVPSIERQHTYKY